jgi:hypothetical protein
MKRVWQNEVLHLRPLRRERGRLSVSMFPRASSMHIYNSGIRTTSVSRALALFPVHPILTLLGSWRR